MELNVSMNYTTPTSIYKYIRRIFFFKNRAKTNSHPRNVLAESDRLDLSRLLRMRHKHHKKAIANNSSSMAELLLYMSSPFKKWVIMTLHIFIVSLGFFFCILAVFAYVLSLPDPVLHRFIQGMFSLGPFFLRYVLWVLDLPRILNANLLQQNTKEQWHYMPQNVRFENRSWHSAK